MRQPQRKRPDLGYSSLRPDSLSQLAAGGNATRLLEGVLRLETASLPCTGELENCAAEPFYKSSQGTVPVPCVQMGEFNLGAGWDRVRSSRGHWFLGSQCTVDKPLCT